MKTRLADAELTSVTAEQWEEARRVLPIVREIAANPARTRAQVVAAAALGCGPTHLYALVRRYSADKRLTSLLPVLFKNSNWQLIAESRSINPWRGSREPF